MKDVGVVAIGRDEGDRLIACLGSIVGSASAVVYVDSGSTDGSVEAAHSLGAEVVALDLSVPFTAARARNAGFARLCEMIPDVEYVQFIDGDCIVVAGWLERARTDLDARLDVAVVCGRRREIHPERSIYNRLADLEWDTPIGEAAACGGDAMIRASAFRQVGGYDPSLIAGEEPDLCVRLRAAGWKVVRIDAEMTAHDLAMTRLGQWWRRSVRAGYAFAEGSARHGAPPERHWVKETRSILLWGITLPVAVLALAWPTRGFSLALLLVYPLQLLRVGRRARAWGMSASDARLYALACVAGKFAQGVGLARYWRNRLLGLRGRLIEYKGPGVARPRAALEPSGTTQP
ncbi:MAG: hypothetical protein JWN86_284 [Planctomycetota bacterium]|nr:hypothetical protein [Planctomycetota bacterium]